MPIISVIVPVYKVEEYLDRCVQSILQQTYTDYELILVNDGSPDRCGQMCDAWAKKDSRIRVIHKKNGGLSDARNAGVEIAQGEWLTFIDSDDYIHPKMLEALYGAVTEHGVRVSICGYTETTGEPLNAEVESSELWEPEAFYYHRCVNATVAWGKLYAKDCFADIRYPVGKVHEDEYVTYRILFVQEKIAVVGAALYGYFHNSSGITRSEWSPRRMDIWGALDQQISFFAERGMTTLARARFKAFWCNIGLQIKQIQSQQTGRKQKRYLRCCYRELQYILKKYRVLMEYNLLDHTELYEAAWPNQKSLIRFNCAVKVGCHRMMIVFLGKKGWSGLKRWFKR